MRQRVFFAIRELAFAFNVTNQLVAIFDSHHLERRAGTLDGTLEQKGIVSVVLGNEEQVLLHLHFEPERSARIKSRFKKLTEQFAPYKRPGPSYCIQRMVTTKLPPDAAEAQKINASTCRLKFVTRPPH